MTHAIALGTGAEFDAIRAMIDRWGPRARGIGDDAAVIGVPRGDQLVASVDTAVEDEHFKAEWLTPREISYRAVAAALSDLAAMAARPLGILVAMTVPQRWRDRLPQLADGIGDALDVASTTIRGGNLSDGSALSITTTVLGAAFAPLGRAGAKVGEHVYVTGRLGAPAAALRLFSSGTSPGIYRERFAHPIPRIAEAMWLAERGASAAIDISDGLVADVGHIAAASRVGIELDASCVPRFTDVTIDDALVGAEEYELAVTSAAEFDVDEFARRFSLPLTRIGTVTSITKQAVVVHGAHADGARGYDHFFVLMRTPLVWLTALVMTVLLGPVVIVAALFKVPQGPESIYTRCVRLWARTINRSAGVRVRVHGADRLHNARGAVFVANHVSWFDVFALASELSWCSFVAKTELRRIPVFGFAAEAVGIVFLDRENRKQAFESYKLAAKEVQRGRAIVVCPEGTRGNDYHLRPFKKGPFVLAIASQSPVIPTIVYGAREVMLKGSFVIRSGVVDLHFLEPIPTAGYDYDHRTELMTAAWSAMADLLQSQYGVATNESPVAKRA